MLIDDTPLDFEIKRVFETNRFAVSYTYSGEFYVNGEYLPVAKVIDISRTMDFELTFASVITIRVLVGPGDMTHVLYPNRNNLEFILTTEKVDPNTKRVSEEEDSISKVAYLATLPEEYRPSSAESNEAEVLPRSTMNLTDLLDITLQLRVKVVEDIDKIDVGGNYRDTTTSELLSSLLTFHTGQIELDDAEKLQGVDVAPGGSEDIHPMVSIEHGVKLSDLADYIQKKAGGIYPTGLAQFIHEQVWYVFPPYDTARYEDSIDKMHLIFVPSKRYPVIERSYLVENGVTTVLVTGEKSIQSDKEQRQQNDGNGVYFADASAMQGDFAKAKGNVALLDRSKTLSEFIGEPRPDGKDNMRMARERITANPYPILSRMARGQGHFFTAVWRNANPDTIKPGMAVKVFYLNNDEVCTIDGVLIKALEQDKLRGEGVIGSSYESVIALMVFVKANQEDTDALGLT